MDLQLQKTIMFIHEWGRIFTHIALALIILLSILNFSTMEISNFLFSIIKLSNNNLFSSQIVCHLTFYVVSFYLLSPIYRLYRLYHSLYRHNTWCFFQARDQYRAWPRPWKDFYCHVFVFVFFVFFCVFL